MRALILGRGNMGRGIRDALAARGDEVVAVLGRSTDDQRPDPAGLGPIDVAFEFSHGDDVLPNVEYALATGARAIVLGTTAWSNARPAVIRALEAADATLVDGPTYSVGTVLFGELAEQAARVFGRIDGFDPYILEWHRRAKADRPSGTAAAIATRLLPHLPRKSRARLAEGTTAPEPDTLEIVSLRAGASPGMHVVGFDAPGESIELRITARDRSAYVAGALLAADWLREAKDRPTGIVRFDAVVRHLLEDPTPAPPTAPLPGPTPATPTATMTPSRNGHRIAARPAKEDSHGHR
jgi:4-hydroxy-tetrahydrodipicolinate reductase